jgi:hypothetical protein
MYWLVEIIDFFIVLTPCDVISYILGHLLIKKIQSKYNVIVSKFKMFLEIERYVHNIMILSFNLHYILISLWH